MSTPKQRKELATLKQTIGEAQATRPLALPRQTIGNRSREARPIQDVKINRLIRKEEADPIVRKKDVAGCNMNF